MSVLTLIPQALLWFVIAYSVFRAALLGRRVCIAKQHYIHSINRQADDFSKVSVICPVYNEDGALLRKAIASWQSEFPKEIILVVDKRDKEMITFAQNLEKEEKRVRCLVEEKPGKRSALCAGFAASSGEWIVFVDSDVIWQKNTLSAVLAPLKHDVHVGGVAAVQRWIASSWLSMLFSYQYSRLQYQTVQYFSSIGTPVPLLQGRTVAYRKAALEGALQGLIAETYKGAPVVGGDDAFLTRYIQAHGWKAQIAPNACFETTIPSHLWTFVLQTLRWSRNAARQQSRSSSASLGALLLKFRQLASGVFDMCNACILLLMIVLALGGLWSTVGVMFIVTFLSVLVPILLLPQRISITFLPVIYCYEHFVGFIRIYGVLTAKNQSWLTR